MHADQWVVFLFCVVVFLFSALFGLWYEHRHPRVMIPPRPTRCAFCGGALQSDLVWSSVCQLCDRGQVGPFDTKGARGIHLGWDPDKPKPAAPFVSHVDVAPDRDIEIRCHEW